MRLRAKLLAGLVLAACWRLPVAQGGELKYIETSKPELLNPVDGARNVIGVRLLELMFRGLMSIDEEGEWVPEIALRKPEYSEETQEFVVELKQGLLWPDGQPITPADVVHSFNTYRDPRSKYGNASSFDVFAEVAPLDDKAIRFKLRHNDPRAIGRLWFYIMPKHLLGDSTYIPQESAFNRNPMGTGPFKITNLEENRIRLGWNDKYYAAPKSIDKVEMTVNPDENTHLGLLLSGWVHLDPVVRPQDLPQLEASLDINVLPYDSQSWYGFAFNCKNEFLKFREVRQALSMAFNSGESLQSIFQGRGQLISGPFTSSSFCFNPEVQPYGYDAPKANKILEELGFVDSDGDGIREANGKPLRLRMVLSKGMSQSNKDVCGDFAQQLRNAQNIEIEMDWQEENAWYEKVFFQRDYDLTFVSWKFDEGSNIYPLFSKTEQEPGYYNIVQFENDEIQEYLERFRNSADNTERTEVGKHLHELIHQECPYNFLWTVEYSAAYRSDEIAKIRIHPFYFFTYIDQWELNE